MKLLNSLLRRKFQSGDYWRQRYEKGRTSGPGSYGRLSEYKAQIVNGIVEDRAIRSVIEFGCGDGNQSALFDIPRYVGVDISPLVIERARSTFADRPDWSFEVADKKVRTVGRHDMSMSLDVIYHLVEDDVFDSYMRDLVSASRRYLLIYASDHDETTADVHVRHRKYSDWLARKAPEFKLATNYEQPYPKGADTDPKTTSFAHFKLFKITQIASKMDS